MKTLHATLLSFALALTLPASDESVLGRMGDAEIRPEDIRAALAGLGEQEQNAISKDPALLNQIVRSFLVQRLVLKEALAKQWDQKPEVIGQLERVRASTLTESYLQSLATPPDSYPSVEELKSAYDTRKAELFVPKSFRIAQIFVASSNEAQLKEVQQKLKDPDADFAALARRLSQETASAARGGEIGWLTEDQIQPEIRRELPHLALHVVSSPIQLSDGWHILKVLDVREAHTPTLEQVRPQLQAQLRAERTKANMQAYLARLVEDHPLAINELALSHVLPKSGK